MDYHAEREAILADVLKVFCEKGDVNAVRDAGKKIAELHLAGEARHEQMLESVKGARDVSHLHLRTPVARCDVHVTRPRVRHPRGLIIPHSISPPKSLLEQSCQDKWPTLNKSMLSRKRRY